jgi:hypothetical protein
MAELTARERMLRALNQQDDLACLKQEARRPVPSPRSTVFSWLADGAWGWTSLTFLLNWSIIAA